MAAVRHLECLKYANFYFPHGLLSQSACSGKNFVAIDWTVADLLQILISNMAAVSHIAFFVRMRGTTSEVALLVFITVQNLVKIRWVVLIISLKTFAIFLEIGGFV